MPPTVAAATMATSGRVSASQASGSAWRRRSTRSRPAVTTSQPLPASRRSSAEPTVPRWPATPTRRPASRNGSVAGVTAPPLAVDGGKVGLDHLGDQRREAGGVAPAQPGRRLARIAEQEIDLGRPEVARIDAHQGVAAGGVEAPLVDALALPDQLPPDLAEGELDELAHRLALAGGQHVVVGGRLLQHPPHALDVVAGMAPVAPGGEVAEIEAVLPAGGDRRDRPGDLAG